MEDSVKTSDRAFSKNGKISNSDISWSIHDNNVKFSGVTQI